MMTPVDQAKAWWDAQPGAGDFSALANWCAHWGYCYSGQDAFIAARTWTPGAGLFDIVERPDCWFVFIAAANGITPIQRFFDLAPFPLPMVAFHRRGILKLYPWQSLRSKVYGNENLSTP